MQALWSHSGGNVLLLRELTLSAVEDGTLTRKDDVWSWRGRGHASARLREVVATRLGRLSEPERAALEYVAVGGALPARRCECSRTTTCSTSSKHADCSSPR